MTNPIAQFVADVHDTLMEMKRVEPYAKRYRVPLDIFVKLAAVMGCTTVPTYLVFNSKLLHIAPQEDMEWTTSPL